MISVVMSTYNEPLVIIEKSISSILNQTYSDFEFIIIIDNPERKELTKLIKKFSEKDKRIKVVVNEDNLGLTASLNKGIDLARGEYIARMDADDISAPERFNKQLAYLEKNNLDLVGCNVTKIDMNDNLTDAQTNYPLEDAAIKKYLRYNNSMAHPTWLGKTELFKKYGYIDFPACEDYEFLTRISLAGKKLGNLKESLLRYRINNNGISSSKKSIQKMSLFYVRKNYRKGENSSYNNFMEYLKSDYGKREQGKIEEYYNKAEKIRQYKNDKKYFRFVIAIFLLFLTSPIAKIKACDSIKLGGKI